MNSSSKKSATDSGVGGGGLERCARPSVGVGPGMRLGSGVPGSTVIEGGLGKLERKSSMMVCCELLKSFWRSSNKSLI
jgi:hypothetical protein